MLRPTSFLASLIAFLYCTVCVKAQAPTPPKPGPEVKKLAIVVGKFTNEGATIAGAMGPNSPAQKGISTEDCRWVAGGFSVLCNITGKFAGMNVSTVALFYYDSSSKMYHYVSIDNGGEVQASTGSVSGDIWTWTGENSWGGTVTRTRYTMKPISKDSFEYSLESGDSESSMKPFVSGKKTRVTAANSSMSKPASK